jgi:DNA-binding beta-propeller fold protein YncE
LTNHAHIRPIALHLPKTLGRRALALLAAALSLAACAKKDTLKTLERVELRDAVPDSATLWLDLAGRVWIGRAGALAAFDSTGRPLGTLPVALKGTPEVLWTAPGRIYLRGNAAATVLDGAGKVLATRRSAAPLAADPRGRWVYTATRTGSVMGLDAQKLGPLWGWPDAGSPVSALAVSPLGDRVYVALAGSGANDVNAGIEIRDALSGRLLSTYLTNGGVKALRVGPDGTLYGVLGGSVVALRHGPEGLKQLWSADVGGIGHGTPDGIRVSPDGARVAVLARGRELHLLAAADGAVLEQSKRAPRDARWDAAGRLWVLGEREIQIVR